MEFSLSGNYCTLRLLDPYTHYQQLYENLKDPSLWKYFDTEAFKGETEMLNYLQCIINGSSKYYVICEKDGTEPLGFFCLFPNTNIRSTLEICSVMFSRKLQKTRIATEAIYLLINLCFEES